jgi:hypothetical protein
MSNSLFYQFLAVKFNRIGIFVVDVIPKCLELLLVEIIIQGIFPEFLYHGYS